MKTFILTFRDPIDGEELELTDSGDCYNSVVSTLATAGWDVDLIIAAEDITLPA